MSIKEREPIYPVPDLRQNKKGDKSFTSNDGDVDIDISDSKWEDLIVERTKVVDSMIANQGLIVGLVKNLETKFELTQPYKEVLVGLFKSFEDISKLLRENMECHVIFDENDKIKEYKTGPISEDEFADYIKIFGSYLYATEQIGDLTHKAYADIISLIRESSEFENFDQATKDDIEAYDEAFKETMPGDVNGTKEQPKE